METLDIRDINFNKLEMLDVLSSESLLYFDDKLLYKLYDNLIDVENKDRKLILLNSDSRELAAIIPHILIKNKLLTYGCAMKKIDDAAALVEYKKDDIFMLLLYEVSLSLKKIHDDPRKIVVGDLHFNNILIDKDERHHFIDFDSCKIDDIPQDRLPSNLMRYVRNRCNFDFVVCSDTDRLCMILSLINSIFGSNIDGLSMNEYDKKAEQIYTLKNMRELVFDIKNNSYGIPSVPYLHEIISTKDFLGKKRVMNK